MTKLCYVWRPKADITLLEIAQAAPVLAKAQPAYQDPQGAYVYCRSRRLNPDLERAINDLPEGARRHFERMEDPDAEIDHGQDAG